MYSEHHFVCELIAFISRLIMVFVNAQIKNFFLDECRSEAKSGLLSSQIMEPAITKLHDGWLVRGVAAPRGDMCLAVLEAS